MADSKPRRHERIRAAARTNAYTHSANQIHDEHLTWNERAAATITRCIGTMACVYLFAALTLPSAPEIWTHGSIVEKVAWLTQTFLQLVLLPLLMVGNSLAQRHAEIRAEQDHQRFLQTAEAAEWITDALNFQLHTLDPRWGFQYGLTDYRLDDLDKLIARKPIKS